MLRPSELLAYGSLGRVLAALEKTGVIEELSLRTEGVSVDSLSRKLDLDVDKLAACCAFVCVNAPEILLKSEGKYLLTPMFKSNVWKNGHYFAMAYEPVLSDLDKLLSRKQSSLDKKIQRDGRYLRHSSALHNSAAWDAVVSFLSKSNIDIVIDCGCSSSDFLRQASKKIPNVRGIGVEVDSTLVTDANQPDADDLSSQQIEVRLGDAAFPEQWASDLVRMVDNKKMSIVGITLWHEFLRNGKEALTKIFKKYQTLFPGSFFIVVEYNGFAWEDMKTLPPALREVASTYQLVHPLTNQGMPMSNSEWLGLFEESGIKVIATDSVDPNLTIFYSLL